MAERISPTIGTSILRVFSISSGLMSIWMNFTCSFHVLPWPNDSIQLSRAPTSNTTSALRSAMERQLAVLCGSVSGTTPLAMDIGWNGISVFLTNSRISSSARAIAAPLPITMSGRSACRSNASAASMDLRAGTMAGAGSVAVHIRRSASLWLRGCATVSSGKSMYTAPGRPEEAICMARATASGISSMRSMRSEALQNCLA